MPAGHNEDQLGRLISKVGGEDLTTMKKEMQPGFHSIQSELENTN
jgi:hypothetical protein